MPLALVTSLFFLWVRSDVDWLVIRN
jgi:hypothetical protein